MLRTFQMPLVYLFFLKYVCIPKAFVTRSNTDVHTISVQKLHLHSLIEIVIYLLVPTSHM